MKRTHRRAYGPLIACMASVALLPVGTVARAQERTAQSIVDGVVNAVCQKQIVLLGELPTHGEAHTFDAKSKIANRLIAQCGFTAILFEAAIYDFIGVERAAETRTATPEQLDNAIGRFWWTRELTPWRRALFEAATRPEVKNSVVVGGLDDRSEHHLSLRQGGTAPADRRCILREHRDGVPANGQPSRGLDV